MNILVTGGAGFIGSALVRYLIGETDHHVLNIDKLTYAGNLSTLTPVADDPRYQFAQIDICDGAAVQAAIADFKPNKIIHLAAESHVDRSVDSHGDFIQTNVVGTFTLLNAALEYWRANDPEDFLFHHVSTEEVCGTLGPTGLFTETTPYSPNSPYSASKASSDHLARAWHETYGLPVVVTNCSNNYGPYQFPEKLVPLMTLNALEGKPLPVYGKGDQIRDWLYVDDHVRALYLVATKGKVGETYNIGGDSEAQNIEIALHVFRILGDRRQYQAPPARLITFVADRTCHDFRYAIDASKIKRELGWRPTVTLEEGLAKTVDWYLDNEAWWRPLLERTGVGERLGLGR